MKTPLTTANRPVRTTPRQAGQALVEFALLLPFLALLLFAIVQYGFIFGAYTSLRHGAQITSRTMSLAGANTNSLSSVAASAISPMLNPANLQPPQCAPVSIGAGATTNAVQVTLTYRLPLIIRFVVPGATGNHLTLTATAVDRKF